MSNALKTVLIVIAILVIAGGLFLGGMLFSNFRSPFGSFGRMPMMGYANGAGTARGGFGPGAGMRGNWGNNQNGNQNGRGFGYGPGSMMGGRGYGPGQGSFQGSRQNPQAQATPAPRPTVTPLTADQAKQAAQTYLQNMKTSGLEVGQVITVNSSAYVEIKETQGGVGAFELWVDPVSKKARLLPGGNMEWNLKYGGVIQNSLYGGQNSTAPTPAAVSADMPISSDQVLKIAQQFLDEHKINAQVGKTPIEFYGYYTIDFSQNGKTMGLLSVNGYNGQIVIDSRFGAFAGPRR